ncbi:MAG: transcription elongation factor GreA, transcription elongation factor GreA [candidate division WWE3 bacterium CSP1-7]|uniref:Transcription elongation factor GreA, transcription elongation factor GreA n=1 Tax=candidate division WWE3 bacterium CSP1-7 TaxID=1576480 RepID=A0A0T5ZY36_UNCKA|nr:MAG: transcription elongation factor GreA, transcription elongation factor GreA [candidate division WWE3 bacterium CSP1-7]
MEYKKIYLTKEGREKLLQRKKQLEEELGKAKKRIGEAAGDEGLWHENAAFEQAESDVSMLIRLIGDVEDQILTAQIVETPTSRDHVMIGSTVKVRIDGIEKVFTVLGESESDLLSGKISCTSPIGKALLGAKAGEQVKAVTPGGSVQMKVLEIT